MSALVHAIRALRCFGAAEPELSLAELSRRLMLSKSNTHRILNLLADEGLLERGARPGRFRLGLGLYELGMRAVSRFELAPRARPVLAALSEATGETALLGVLDAAEVVYIQKAESARLLRVHSSPGLRTPAHSTATGKAILAWRPAADVERVIARGLPADTERTITEAAAFRAHLADVRAQGYAVSDGEFEPWTCSVAAPVLGDADYAVAAVTVAGPVQRIVPAHVPALARRLMEAAAQLARLPA